MLVVWAGRDAVEAVPSGREDAIRSTNPPRLRKLALVEKMMVYNPSQIRLQKMRSVR